LGNGVIECAVKEDCGTALASPPNGPRQWPTQTGAQFAYANCVTGKEVHCTRGLGGDAGKTCCGSETDLGHHARHYA